MLVQRGGIHDSAHAGELFKVGLISDAVDLNERGRRLALQGFRRPRVGNGVDRLARSEGHRNARLRRDGDLKPAALACGWSVSPSRAAGHHDRRSGVGEDSIHRKARIGANSDGALGVADIGTDLS